MNKAYLSKSHENLASGIRYRSNTGKSAKSPRPLSWVGINSDPVSYIPVPVKTTPNASTPTTKQSRQVWYYYKYIVSKNVLWKFIQIIAFCR